jgi:hypothetical protein
VKSAAERALRRLERLRADAERLHQELADGGAQGPGVEKGLRALRRGLEGVVELKGELTDAGSGSALAARLHSLGAALDEIAERAEPGRVHAWMAGIEEVESMLAGATPLVDPGWLEANRDLVEERLGALVEVREPLLLISQVQRSGGTLLSQLLDGHPQLHAHPHELYIGHPHKSQWPSLDPSAGPAALFRVLQEAPAVRAFEEGYTKTAGGDDSAEVFPFELPPQLQAALFERCLTDRGPARSERDVLDCYMTSYFNAWLDNANLSGGKRWVTGFVPRLHMTPGSLERFFAAYPDGLLVSIVRDPRGWWASARAQRESLATKRVLREYASVESGMEVWTSSAKATLDAVRRYDERVHVMRFEAIVGAPHEAMGTLATRVGIDFDDVLVSPSFNGRPIKAASSFEVERHGILEDPLTRYREELDPGELTYIESEAGGLYAEVAALAA